MNKFKLSICIPTFERANYLSRLLESIHRLNKELKENIEICISDNNSKDATFKIIENEKLDLNISYYRNKENIGGIRNVLSVINKAKGDFIWVLGDDDLIIKEEFEIFYKERIKCAKDTEWFFVGTKNEKNEKLFNHTRISLFQNKWGTNLTLLKFGIYNFGFLGNHIFPRKFVNSSFNSLDLTRNSFPHVTLMLYQSKSYKFIDTYLSIKSGNLEWDSFTWYKVLLSYIISINFSCYLNPVLKTFILIRFGFSKTLSKHAIYGKLSPKFSYKEIRFFLKELIGHNPFWFVYVILFYHLVLNIFLSKISNKWIRRIFKIEGLKIRNLENEGTERKL